MKQEDTENLLGFLKNITKIIFKPGYTKWVM